MQYPIAIIFNVFRGFQQGAFTLYKAALFLTELNRTSRCGIRAGAHLYRTLQLQKRVAWTGAPEGLFRLSIPNSSINLSSLILATLFFSASRSLVPPGSRPTTT